MQQLIKIEKQLILFFFGALSYGFIEVIWRGFTHWSMFLAGGLCFLSLGLINSTFSGRIPFIAMCVIGAFFITSIEYVFGVLFNIVLRMNVWDYSKIPMNLFGQICLPYTVLWIGLSALGILLDRFLRRQMFGDVSNNR